MTEATELKDNDRDRARDVLERMTLAVYSLCTGKGDVRSRLKNAISSHLYPFLQESNFPVELRSKYRNILQSATKYDASDLDRQLPLPFGKSHNEHEDRLESTMRRIRRETGARIAREIWDLYWEVRHLADVENPNYF